MPPRNHRLWIPATLCTLAAVIFIAVHLKPELERNIKAWITGGLLILTVTLNFLWFVLLSGFPWRTRLLAAAVVLLGGGILSQFVKVDGSLDGTGQPRLVWKTSRPVPVLPAPTPAVIPAPHRTNLTALIADVPQFFGPARDGVVRDAGLATNWAVNPPRLLWRQPIGGGWSAFAVVGQQAFTQEQRGPGELVTCYDPFTGQLLWAHTNQARFFQWQGGEGPRATPTVHSNHVFAIGGTGILDCLDVTTGHRLWTRDVLAENKLPNLTWGISASPLVYDDTVVVTGAAANGPTVLAYHRQTGQPLWRAGTDKASYASPVLANLAGRRVILSVNAASLTIHDPANGTILVDHPWASEKSPRAAQPVVLDHDRVFLSSGYGVGCLMLQIKALSGGKLAVTELWRGRTMKNQFNSCAGRDGFIYGLDDGFLACIESATGERRWKDGRFGSGQSLLVDDLILVQSEPGSVVLARARPDAYEELGRLAALDGKTWNHPTLAGRLLLVRNDQQAACYELPAAANR